MNINPKVVDISHYDRLVGKGFQSVREAGIIGVIHKSSEGTGVVDRPYADRRKLANDAGLLWGAYHFIRPCSDYAAQADFFLRCATPDDHTLVSLDFEVPTVPVDEARAFIEEVETKLGRKVVLYSGNTVKEDLGKKHDPWWAERRLWLAQYSSKWTVQPSWEAPWLWQFTGDGVGPKPHMIPGIEIDGGLDISSFDGTDEELIQQWVDDAHHEPQGASDADHPNLPTPTFSNVIMTEFCGEDDGPQTSAYTGKVIDPRALGVALPFHFKVPPKVRITGSAGITVDAPVVDVGPWFTNDPWFNTPDGRPRAESVARTNGAGIDATPATWEALGGRRGKAKITMQLLP